MQYAIVYKSNSGNTAQLAEKIKSLLPQDQCLYFGPPTQEAFNAPLIFVGFWTWCGTCTEDLSKFLKTVHHKNLFLFGTAGYGQNDAYFSQILKTIEASIDSTNQVVGTYMCQGKMPISVRERYEKMLLQEEDHQKTQEMIANFDQALQHPNGEDLARLALAIQQLPDMNSITTKN